MRAKAAEKTRMTQQTFEELYTRYRQVVFYGAYSVTGDKADAEDVFQALFLKLIDQEFDEQSVRDPAGYLYRAGANLARDMYRGQERRSRHHTGDDVRRLKDPATDPNPGDRAMRERLLDAMARLDPEQADILLLHFERGYSDAEIADLLGKTRGAVAMAMHRAKERLKELLCSDSDETKEGERQ